jgi:putative endonuclease
LRQAGFGILKKNYRTPFGEIDIIALESDTLCFVEVKTRSTLAFGHPFESVGHRKQKRLIRAAKYFLSQEQSAYKHLRFDVMAIVRPENGDPQYQLLRGAFDA